jgi:hypothetical protein
VYDAHDMLISQAFKEPDSSLKDGNLQHNKEATYNIIQAKIPNDQSTTTESHPTSLEVILNINNRDMS